MMIWYAFALSSSFCAYIGSQVWNIASNSRKALQRLGGAYLTLLFFEIVPLLIVAGMLLLVGVWMKAIPMNIVGNWGKWDTAATILQFHTTCVFVSAAGFVCIATVEILLLIIAKTAAGSNHVLRQWTLATLILFFTITLFFVMECQMCDSSWYSCKLHLHASCPENWSARALNASPFSFYSRVGNAVSSSTSPQSVLKLAAFGNARIGKSFLLNMFCGNRLFEARNDVRAVTLERNFAHSKIRPHLCGRFTDLLVVNLPGLIEYDDAKLVFNEQQIEAVIRDDLPRAPLVPMFVIELTVGGAPRAEDASAIQQMIVSAPLLSQNALLVVNNANDDELDTTPEFGKRLLTTLGMYASSSEVVFVPKLRNATSLVAEFSRQAVVARVRQQLRRVFKRLACRSNVVEFSGSIRLKSQLDAAAVANIKHQRAAAERDLEAALKRLRELRQA